MPIAKHLTLFFLVLTPLLSQGIDLSKMDYSPYYKKSGVRFSYQIAKQDTLHRIILSARYKRNSGRDQLENFRLLSQEKFTSSKHRVLTSTVSKSHRLVLGESHDLTVHIPQTHNYLIIAFDYHDKSYYFDLPVHAACDIPLASFVLTPQDTTSILDVMTTGDTIEIVSLDNSPLFHLYEYHDAFSHALPPMATRPPDSAANSLEIHQYSTIPSTFALSLENTLYFVQKDSSSNRGQSCLSQIVGFPNLKTIEDIVQPLVYICTREEYQNILSAENRKKAFEDFWLKIIPSKKKASETIKKYYDRIEEANTLFTTYKTGWKTDPGMIYTVYGPPDQVSRSEQEEIWKYQRFEGEISFTFAKQVNLFTQHHYVLIRAMEYSGVWYSEIKKWRTGNS
ncbi:hypothetical protein BFP72_15930 [Reichenbachiella sp. 5M10]|uniref:GWxTD domain-containing protein n=1 Tax=Reichenbachiella sp. 5M10 TaxID=1889772 RepID=UPI000C160952|nr:GWxTD domain-containing protein [Reichenbachiella sp. 5M10]PIB36783.1 hypothetical protein BFP72_15930 [Reichenbachiella sp. 5M10]